MSDTPRTEALVATQKGWHPDQYNEMLAHARQLERELALKDADMLLERDRAEKAKAQVKMLVELLIRGKSFSTHREFDHDYQGNAEICPHCCFNREVEEALANNKEES